MLCHSDPDTVIVTCYPATHRPRAHHPPQSGCLDHKWPPFLVVLISTTGHYWVCDYVTLTSIHPIFPNKITKYERRPAAVQWPGLSWWGGGSSKWWICFRPRLPTICYNLVQLCGVSTECGPRPSPHVEHTLQNSSIDTIKKWAQQRYKV